MKTVILLCTIFFTAIANDFTSSIKIPLLDCQQYKYANTVGGKFHSRSHFKAAKHDHAVSLAKYPQAEALALLQSRHSDILINTLDITTVGCNVLYKAADEAHAYYFDAGTLELVAHKAR